MTTQRTRPQPGRRTRPEHGPHARRDDDRPRGLLRREDGLGVVEAMVAIVLLAVVLGGITQMFAVAQMSRRATMEEANRWTAAQTVLERLVNVPGDSTFSGSGTVSGYPVTWEVTGNLPRTYTITISTKAGALLQRTDTLVTRRR